MRRELTLLLPTLLTGVLLAACSNGSDGSDGSNGNGAAPPSGRSAALEFAQCMRQHGVEAFPDPDASGGLTVDAVANNSAIDTESPAWRAATAACRDLEPAGFTGTKRSAAEQATALEFARCIREHGVEDFPDPDPNGALVDTTRIPSLSGDDADLSQLNAAMDTCGDVYADDLGLRK